jgi:hypothetical protein
MLRQASFVRGEADDGDDVSSGSCGSVVFVASPAVGYWVAPGGCARQPFSSVSATSTAPPAPHLARIRSGWLSAAVANLRADPAVAGVGLIGSLGAGRADDWSDIDMVIVVDDPLVDRYAAPDLFPADLGKLAFASDSRHNAPRGARACGAQYIIDGLPLWVDRYAYPLSWAAWPADSAVMFDRHGIDRLALTYAQFQESVEHEQAVPKTHDEVRTWQLALIPIAGKDIARRSPRIAQMIKLVGGPDVADATWEQYLAALRERVDGHDLPAAPDSIAATHAYLDIVAATLP